MGRPLPLITAAGIFDSRHKFGNLKESSWRQVQYYEIEFYFEPGGISYLNDREVSMQYGNVLIAKPGDLRKSTLHFRCHFLHLESVEGPLKLLLEHLPGILRVKKTDDLEHCFTEIARLLTDASPYGELFAVGELLRLLERLQTLSEKEAKSGRDNILERARTYLTAHFSEELSTEQLAEHCSISASYLHRLFAQELGTSPHEYLLQLRLAEAKKQLIDDRDSVRNIAARCGFHSVAYFSDCFRRHVGCSPSQFKRLSSHLP